MKSKTIVWIKIVRRVNPKIICHIAEPSLLSKINESKSLNMQPKNTPKAIINWFNAPSVPEISFGDISLIINGVNEL